MIQTPKFGAFQSQKAPAEKFLLFTSEDIFSNESYHYLSASFESLPWEEKKTDFYSQSECLITPTLNHPLTTLYSPSFLLPFKENVEEIIGIPLRDEVRLIAHKLTTSQEIGIHTDYCDPNFGYENFRFIFQFSCDTTPMSGGELYFLQSKDKRDVIKKIPYEKNKGVCFQITPHSYHYVSPVRGLRYTLVMYLWDKRKPYDGSGMKMGTYE